MDKFIDVIVDGILSNFDFGFMFIVNVLTYIIIKVIDYFNGDNKVPTWQKRCVLVISIATMAGIYIAAGYDNCTLYTSDAADDMQCGGLGGGRITKKKRTQKI